MPSLGTITFTGKSGSPYQFRMYPLGTVFRRGFAAVYVVTQRALRQNTGTMRHRVVLLGQGDDLRRPGVAEADAGVSHANCICVHPEPDETLRVAIQHDLTGAAPRTR